MCCGGRDFCLSTTEEPEGKLATYVDNTNFYEYSCLVNHYFLYINQETRDIYHHQTCMVNLDNDVAPIGNLDNSGAIIERLEGYNREKKWPVISCPKTFCGCGMCVDKMDKSYDIKEHNFGITSVALVPNELKKMEDTRTITVRNNQPKGTTFEIQIPRNHVAFNRESTSSKIKKKSFSPFSERKITNNRRIVSS